MTDTLPGRPCRGPRSSPRHTGGEHWRRHATGAATSSRSAGTRAGGQRRRRVRLPAGVSVRAPVRADCAARADRMGRGRQPVQSEPLRPARGGRRHHGRAEHLGSGRQRRCRDYVRHRHAHQRARRSDHGGQLACRGARRPHRDCLSDRRRCGLDHDSGRRPPPGPRCAATSGTIDRLDLRLSHRQGPK